MVVPGSGLEQDGGLWEQVVVNKFGDLDGLGAGWICDLTHFWPDGLPCQTSGAALSGPFSLQSSGDLAHRRFCPSAQPMNTPAAATIMLNAMLHRPGP